MFLKALRGPFAFHGFSCGPCCSEEFRCVVPGGATSNQNDSHGDEFVPHSPRSHFSGIGIGPYPLPWMQHATNLAQMPNVFLFCFSARPSLRARVLLILCFSGSGGCARERKKWKKMLDFSHQHTRLGHTNVCLIRAWFCKKSVPIVRFACISAFLRDFKRFWDILSSRSPFWAF